MAGRYPKEGLDFADWDTDVFLNKDIVRLMEAQGCAGFVIFFFLAQMARKFKGYFYEWSYDDAAITAKMIGAGVRSETVEQTVNLCLRLGLFDKGLFERHGILTSRRIQKNYVRATADRKYCAVREEFDLLNDFEKSDGEGQDFHTPAPNLSSRNAHFPPGNSISPPGNADREDKTEEIQEIHGIIAEGSGQENVSPSAKEKSRPTFEQVSDYCKGRNWPEREIRFFFDLYDTADWRDVKGRDVSEPKQWKRKAIWWEKNNADRIAAGQSRKAPATQKDTPQKSDQEKLETMQRMLKKMKNE